MAFVFFIGLCFLLVNKYVKKEKLIHIPEIKKYIKMIWKPSWDYGYVLIGENENLKIEDGVDYLKVYKGISTVLIFDMIDDRRIFIKDQLIFRGDEKGGRHEEVVSSVSFTNQVEYSFQNSILKDDTLFCSFSKYGNSFDYVLLHPYLSLVIYPFFDGYSMEKVAYTLQPLQITP